MFLIFMIISIIAAVSNNNVIGKDNKLPWHLPGDLKRFKELTTGHTIIMGRKTFESIGRPLPSRRNIVVTRNKDYKADGVEIIHSIKEALDLVKNEDEVFIIGGEEIYKLALPMANKIYLTRINKEYDGDAFFPELGPEWSGTECIKKEGYEFCMYEKAK
jgi:dihydrofolate reductase